MLRLPDNNDSRRDVPGGNNWGTNPDGQYEPFGNTGGIGIRATSLEGGGGGGSAVFTPPVKPNPIFIPPSYEIKNKIKVILLSSEDAQFDEDTKNIGIGKSITVERINSSFGTARTYKATVNGRQAKNYFVVAIQKKFNTIRDLEIDKDLLVPNLNLVKQTSTVLPKLQLDTLKSPVPNNELLFGYNMNKPVGLNEYLYAENISIKEFEYNEKSKSYVFLKEKALDKDGGVINLEFTFIDIKKEEENKVIEYSIDLISNYAADLTQKLSLKYEIVLPGNQVVDSAVIPIEDSVGIPKKIDSLALKNAVINFKLIENLQEGYELKDLYYKSKDASSYITNDSAVGWKEVQKEFSIPAKELGTGIIVNAIYDRNIIVAKPELRFSTTQYDKEVRDSDKDAIINILYNHYNADYIDVYIDDDDVFRVEANQGYIPLSFVKDFKKVFGKKKIILSPFSDEFGSGLRYEILINFIPVNDFPNITQIIFPTEIEIPSFSDGNIEWDVTYNTKAVSSVDVDIYLKDKSRVSLYKNLGPTGTFKLGLRDLATKFPQWNGSSILTLIFKPYNRSGETELVGNEYEISTSIIYPTIKLDEDIIRKSIYDAFVETIKFNEPEKESKYLTHLLNLGNDGRVIISSWEEDNWTLSEKGEDELGNTVVKNEVKSIILKLYEPLPPEIQVNSTMWITKLMTNPLIETVVLNEEAQLEYPYIQGPNFDIEVDFVKGQSTNYESLDDLIISASSSTTLIQNYLSASLVDTSELNIKYVSGSVTDNSAEILWDNFVHFSSAAERVNNFVYKVQLIENYETLIVSASVGPQTGSLAAQQEVQRLNAKKSSLIQGFDGFETFLYTSSSYTTNSSGSMTWPYNGTTRLVSTNTNVVKWYENTLALATLHDNNNSNWLVNNIPQYIRINPENENYLLFFSMVGHHFDTIYYYTKAIEKTRSLGYQSDNGIANKVLYEMLKSFSWDAKNLGGDKELWNYVFGEDKVGNQKENTPSNIRSKEVWRRIINNLPYLLKHKGTRRGIYALMACYGIPSSNLSIMEFGGPEVTDDSKNKLLMDGTSYALKMKSGEYITIGSYPNGKTVELFIKPAKAGNYTMVHDGTTNLTISGSVGSIYGKVKFGVLETPLLPLFNGRYFGISLANWTTYRELNVMQVESDRLIFSASVTGSLTGLQTTFTIGAASNGFSGSIDEFRIWNTPLSRSIFEQHVYYPEMVNGNNISASTTDLDIRFDFEYPKNLAVSTSILNVSPIISLGTNSRNYYEDNNTTTGMSGRPGFLAGTAVSFTSVTTHPYQFEVLNRNVVLEMPDIGTSRYATNKVRFEEQSLLSDLSSKSRSTRKAFDNQPIDSNRVGLFFSPNKELNLDIAKAFGDSNFNEYIGDPSDRFKSGYKALDNIREYYFQRINGRDIYSYINLIRAYEKAMFEDIKKMLPARVTATTGILVEPHFLERSKYQYTKPTGSNDYYEGESQYTFEIVSDNTQYNTIVDADMSEQVFGENNQYQSIIDSDFSENLFAENNQYQTTIFANDEIGTSGEQYLYEVSIPSDLYLGTKTKQDVNDDTNKLVGKDDYVDLGFQLFCSGGHAIRNYYDTEGILRKERIRVNLIEEEKTKTIIRPSVSITVGSNRLSDPRSEPVEETIIYTEKKLLIQPFSGSVAPTTGNGITKVTPVSGYLPTHYKYTSDLTTGLQNAYYKGCKNTSATTLDGSSPIEVFVTNPNVIKVTGRDNNEPIIDIE
jgi:hypothetical protein